MMATAASREPSCDEFDDSGTGAVGGPVSVAWREGTLTRAKELESLSAWVLANHHPRQNPQELANAICQHLQAAREAAAGAKLSPKKRLRIFRNASLIERAMSNLDAAEVDLLNFAPPRYVLGQLPGLLNHVQRHLIPTDPRRQELERIAKKLGVKDSDHPLLDQAKEPTAAEKTEKILIERIAKKLRVDSQDDLLLDHIKEPTPAEKIEKILEDERGKIVTAVRGASSAALREQLRVRSFRNVLMATIIALILLAAGVAFFGWVDPTKVPLCFRPALESGETVVVCPTAYSERLAADQQPGPELDERVKQAARRWDIFTVEMIGLTAAAVAAASSIRSIRGSSEALNLPVLLAVLKLPLGAITALLGLLLVRGEFIPGLSALDTPGQILSWALVFGYAQQLFTRFVDQQGQTVLNSVRAADKPSESSLSRP